jgi:tyrosyl-tRNA synthetase
VKRLQGEEAAARAEADFETKFRKRDAPSEIEEYPVETGFPIGLIEAMVSGGLARSNGEARRLIDQRGIKVNGTLATTDDPLKPGDVVQVGKRRWVRFVVK